MFSFPFPVDGNVFFGVVSYELESCFEQFIFFLQVFGVLKMPFTGLGVCELDVNRRLPNAHMLYLLLNAKHLLGFVEKELFDY